MVGIHLSFLKTFCFPEWYYFTSHHIHVRVPGASFPCQHLLLSVFIFSHSGRCVRVSIVILICISRMTNVLSIISWVHLPSMYLLGATVPVQIIFPLWGLLILLLLSFENHFYILVIILYQIWDLQIVSPHLWLVFIFLMVSIREQKFLILMRFSLSIFPFMGIFFLTRC